MGNCRSCSQRVRLPYRVVYEKQHTSSIYIYNKDHIPICMVCHKKSQFPLMECIACDRYVSHVECAQHEYPSCGD